MVRTTLLYGFLITGLGIIGYLATGQASKTALIPCIFGLPVIALGILSWTKPNLTLFCHFRRRQSPQPLYTERFTGLTLFWIFY